AKNDVMVVAITTRDIDSEKKRAERLPYLLLNGVIEKLGRSHFSAVFFTNELDFSYSAEGHVHVALKYLYDEYFLGNDHRQDVCFVSISPMIALQCEQEGYFTILEGEDNYLEEIHNFIKVDVTSEL